MICTTLNAIRRYDPCKASWCKLLSALGKTKADNVPLPFIQILDTLGLEDALWAARAAPEHDHRWRLLACTYVRRIQHTIDDPRVIETLGVVWQYAWGEATEKELTVARCRAWAVLQDTPGGAAAYYATIAVVESAAVKVSLWDIAYESVWALDVVGDAQNNERTWQEEQFRRAVS